MIDPKFVYEALATGLITEAEAQGFLDPERDHDLVPDQPIEAEPGLDQNGHRGDGELDQTSGRRNAERLEHVIDCCASGAPAFTTINANGIEEIATGRILPAPPSTTTGEQS